MDRERNISAGLDVRLIKTDEDLAGASFTCFYLNSLGSRSYSAVMNKARARAPEDVVNISLATIVPRDGKWVVTPITEADWDKMSPHDPIYAFDGDTHSAFLG